MNVNLQKYVGLVNPGDLSVGSKTPDVSAEGVSPSGSSAPFSVTEGGKPTVGDAAPKDRPELDEAPKSTPAQLKKLERALKDLDKYLSLGAPLGAPANGAPANGAPANGAPSNGAPANGNGAPVPAPNPHAEAAFNLVALLDLMQQAANEGSKVSREIKQQEREMKASAQEKTAANIRANGESSAQSAFNSAMIGLGSAIGSTALSSVSFGLQYKAYNESSLGKFEVDASGAQKELDLVKSYKDVPGEAGLSIGPGGQQPGSNLDQGNMIELRNLNAPKDAPKVESSPFSPTVAGLKGKVDACKAKVDETSKGLKNAVVSDVDAKAKLGDAVKADKAGDVSSAKNELDVKHAERLKLQKDMETQVEEHIGACTEYRDQMDQEIADKQALLAKETVPEKKLDLQNQIIRMQSVRNKECFQMAKNGLTDSLEHKLNFIHGNMKAAQGEVTGSKSFIDSKEWEVVSGFVRQMLDATGQGLNRMDSERSEAAGKEAEHMSRAAETRADAAIEASEGMRQNFQQVQKMVIDLRQAIVQADHESMRAILRM